MFVSSKHMFTIGLLYLRMRVDDIYPISTLKSRPELKIIYGLIGLSWEQSKVSVICLSDQDPFPLLSSVYVLLSLSLTLTLIVCKFWELHHSGKEILQFMQN